jgi:hypothetical protein
VSYDQGGRCKVCRSSYRVSVNYFYETFSLNWMSRNIFVKFRTTEFYKVHSVIELLQEDKRTDRHTERPINSDTCQREEPHSEIVSLRMFQKTE